ncbi:MAG: type II CRISPR-associated endonuclease Cas1 [Chitinophagales bacterium]|nr:type II CRISPR-associated endonuclease Cas1 [Chitinophagales bacterium]MDW8420202.1 type II CRISPR-associated endonuclease Cas1 [Chitinophagales bacterium]
MIKRTIHIGSPCKLSLRLEQLHIQYSHIKGQEDMPDRTVPITDIGVLVLEHDQITLTHPLLAKLAEQNVALICCNERRMPAGMLLTLSGHSLQAERFRAQIDASEPLRKQLWKQTVAAKILNQARVLEYYGADSGPLPALATDLKSGDKDNAEATAAAHYWRNLFPPAINFYRKRDGEPPNQLLNYGYAVLRAIVARCLAGSGLLPTLGIFHRNRYNDFPLADDIMEPYRPFVDFIVRQLIAEGKDYRELNTENRNRLLNIAAVDVRINKETSPLFVAVQRTTASLAQCFTGEAKKILYPEFSYTAK